MFHRRLLKIVLGGLVVLAGFVLPACQSTGDTEALTGRTSERGSPRWESHGKGNQWGRVVYDR